MAGVFCGLSRHSLQDRFTQRAVRKSRSIHPWIAGSGKPNLQILENQPLFINRTSTFSPGGFAVCLPFLSGNCDLILQFLRLPATVFMSLV
jgi:hypothetical protein